MVATERGALTYLDRQRGVWLLLKSDSLTPLRKLILLCLNNYAGNDGGAWPSIGCIAENCCAGRRTVEQNISWLADHGYLEIVSPGKRPTDGMPDRPRIAKFTQSNWYIILWDRVFSGGARSALLDVDGDEMPCVPGVENTDSGGAKSAHPPGIGDAKFAGGVRESHGGGARPPRSGSAKFAHKVLPIEEINETSTSSPPRKARPPESSTTESREEVEGMLLGAGIPMGACRELSAIGYADVAYVGAMIESVRCDKGVQSIPRVLDYRIREHQPPSPAGAAAWRSRREPVRQQELSAARRLEAKLSAANEAAEIERDRRAAAGWLDAKTDARIGELREAYLRGEEIEEFERERVRRLPVRSQSLAWLLMGFEADSRKVVA